MPSRHTLDFKLGIGWLLAGAILGVSCDADRSPTSGIQTGTAPPTPVVEDSPCVDTFPVDLHEEFKPEFGVDRPAKEAALPRLLSKTGLYTDIRAKETHPLMWEFTPQFELWSDGADKTRWAYIPECSTIDTQDMDDWQFPVGSRFFKEFSVDGRRIETRLIERIGTGPRDFAFVSYLWDEDESEARIVDAAGLPNARGSGHDIPSKSGCLRCHGTYSLGGGRPSRALGFSALQLSHEGAGLTLSELVDTQRLSHPPVDEITVPGDALTQAALGVLHANCGNCHNDTSDRVPQVDLSLWLETSATTVEETGAWQTAVDQPTAIFKDQHVTARIAPGQPEQSAVLYRMLQRHNNAQMPPLASHTIDEVGTSTVAEWIGSLP